MSEIYKKVLTKDDLKDPTIRGMTKIAGSVKRTLGPGGLTIIIERVGQSLDGTPLGPKLTKDGVSVAEECGGSDKEEDVIIQAVKSICRKTNTIAGDGTTTAIVLGEAILLNTIEALKDPSLNPQLVRESLESVCKDVIRVLTESAIKVNDIQKIKEVATISANGDSEIGSVIAEAFEAVGAEGVITIDEGKSNGLTLDVVDGYQFNRGAEARDTFYNVRQMTHFEGKDCAVVLFDGDIMQYTDIAHILKTATNPDSEGKPTQHIPPMLIVANQFSNSALQFMAIQKVEGGLSLCAVRGPHMTNVRTGYYDDLAAYTGGTRLGNGGKAISEMSYDDIGFCGKVIVDKYKTTLYDGFGHEDGIIDRVDQLKLRKNAAESPYDAQVLNDRIAALTNGVAKIGVGGATELEVKERYDRVEDALNAARAAIQEGVVPGGGCTLLRLAMNIPSNDCIGKIILEKSLQAPFYQILENIGLKPDEQLEISHSVLSEDGVVYDARNKIITDAMQAGIIDPVKVTRTALENAVSIASLLSTAGGAIIYDKK